MPYLPHHNDNPDGVQQAIAASGFQQAPRASILGRKITGIHRGLNSPDGNGNATFYATYPQYRSGARDKYDL